ncbi:MAG: hypothetical protein JWQ93_1813 [Marmoricola sp.]|nr:hypothetical protein [Marmoricola sp.]
MITTVLVLPSPPALLAPRSVHDPVAELRRACAVAVSTLPEERPVVVLAAPLSQANAARGVTEPLGHRVAATLLGGTPFEPRLALPCAAAALLEVSEPTTLVVMADGSARRDERAPGHLHPDAVPFDERIEAALRSGDAETLAALDPEVAEELWCEGVGGLRALGEVARGHGVVGHVSYADAPYGVAWWVARWDLTRRDLP